MNEPKLPTLSGEMRELRDGDRLELNGGWITPPGAYCCRRTSYGIPGQFDFFEWDLFGVYTKSNRPELNIKTILGPSEETHGDGTVTKIRPLPVTLDAYVWQLGEPIAFRCGLADEKVMLLDGYPADLQQDTKTPRLILARKPAPTPTYTERLIAAVKAGEVVLPPKAVRLEYSTTSQCVGVWADRNEFLGGWDVTFLGRLPERKPGDETTIDLAAVRAALTKENK